jgi:hypothetical protein
MYLKLILVIISEPVLKNKEPFGLHDNVFIGVVAPKDFTNFHSNEVFSPFKVYQFF